MEGFRVRVWLVPELSFSLGAESSGEAERGAILSLIHI